MKLGFPADNNRLDARIADRMSNAAWLVVVDSNDMTLQAEPVRPSPGGPGVGIRMASRLIDMGATVLMTGYMSPSVIQPLENIDIKIITNVTGSIQHAVEHYQAHSKSVHQSNAPVTAITALKLTLKQFRSMVPVLTGVLLLMGIIQTALSKELILSVLSHNPLWDAVTGTFLGSIFTGNPINVYIIGQTLLEMGIGWTGICALMMSWVTVGMAQLPAEAQAMGLRFALVRNGAAVIITILASILTVFFSGVWQ